MNETEKKLIEHYMSVSIHKDFYYNKYLGISTVIKEYESVERILVDSRFMACITVQIPQLNKIEYQYGSTAYNNLLDHVSEILKTLKKDEFRSDDIFVVDLFDSDTFIMFLSPPRERETQILNHLETIAERTRVTIDQKIFDVFRPYIKEYSRPSVGFALVINNPMINNMRLVMQLITSSKKMGDFMAMKQENISRYNLQKIIIEEKIKTVFQPIVALNSLEIIGYEALSRGPVDTEFASPLLLFLLASEFGLSFELDSLCRKQAFQSIRPIKSDKKFFVNTLTMTIHDPEFRGAYLKELLADLKMKPENVVFEVNEKLAIDNYDLFRNAMQDYSDIGIVHASDDIGHGNADLERIMELHPGYMKIDISLVRDIDTSYIKQEIIKAMVSLARGIKSQVIAEGIETRAEYEKLKELGVDYGQGYLFGKPCEDPSACLPTF